MTEAGSQLATALPGDSFHTDRLSLLPHWEAQTDKGGLLRFQGKGKLFGRLLTQSHGGFLLERVAPQEWWSTRDLVRLEGRLLTFLRRADRLVKVLGELVDPDAVQDVLRRSVPEAVVEAVPHPRAGMELVACGPSAAPLKQACREWNASAPGPQRIRAVMETPIPLTVMGKLDRNRLRSQLSDHPEKLKGIY